MNVFNLRSRTRSFTAALLILLAVPLVCAQSTNLRKGFVELSNMAQSATTTDSLRDLKGVIAYYDIVSESSDSNLLMAESEFKAIVRFHELPFRMFDLQRDDVLAMYSLERPRLMISIERVSDGVFRWRIRIEEAATIVRTRAKVPAVSYERSHYFEDVGVGVRRIALQKLCDDFARDYEKANPSRNRGL